MVRVQLSVPAAQGWARAAGLVGLEQACGGRVGVWGDVCSPKMLYIARTALLTHRALPEAVGLAPPPLVSVQIWSDPTEVDGKTKICEAEMLSQRAQADSGASAAGMILHSRRNGFIYQPEQSIL